MKLDLETLAKIVEERVPTARATCVPEANQIVVTFTNRPDVEVALLTPWMQRGLVNGTLVYQDITELIQSLQSIQTPSF